MVMRNIYEYYKSSGISKFIFLIIIFLIVSFLIKDKRLVLIILLIVIYLIIIRFLKAFLIKRRIVNNFLRFSIDMRELVQIYNCNQKEHEIFCSKLYKYKNDILKLDLFTKKDDELINLLNNTNYFLFINYIDFCTGQILNQNNFIFTHENFIEALADFISVEENFKKYTLKNALHQIKFIQHKLPEINNNIISIYKEFEKNSKRFNQYFVVNLIFDFIFILSIIIMSFYI